MKSAYFVKVLNKFQKAVHSKLYLDQWLNLRFNEVKINSIVKRIKYSLSQMRYKNGTQYKKKK